MTEHLTDFALRCKRHYLDNARDGYGDAPALLVLHPPTDGEDARRLLLIHSDPYHLMEVALMINLMMDIRDLALIVNAARSKKSIVNVNA